MKTSWHTYFLFSFCFLFLQTGTAQLNWTSQFPGTAGSYRNDLFFLNTSLGWVVGQGGSIHHTTDGGNTWVLQTSGTSVNLNGVWFVDAQKGWIVGDGELLLQTLDGGDTWTTHAPPSGTSSDLHTIFFTDEMHGWICGFWDNFFTTDGGNTWVAFAAGSGTEYETQFVNNNDGWICGVSGYLAYSNDGGSTWTQVSGFSGNPKALYAHSFNEVTIVCDDGSIYQTADAGFTWNIRVAPSSLALYDVSFSTPDIGVAVGYMGTVLVTLDGGYSWSYSSVISTDIYVVQMVDGGTGWFCGQGQYVYKSAFGPNDMEIYAYHGLDTLCIGIETEVLVTLVNYGPGPIYDADIVIADGPNPLLNYHWSGNLLAGSYQDVYLGYVAVEHSGNYNGVVTGDSVTWNNISTKYITAIEPGAGVSEDQVICQGDSVTVNAYGANSYVWFTDNEDSTNAYQTVLPEYTRPYHVYLTTDYCNFYDSVLVIVNDCREIVTAISPNGDGVNDFLYIDVEEGVGNTVVIYNRWGDAIRTLVNYDNEQVFWDGSDDYGNMLVETTFYYTYETSDQSVRRSSWIQIVR